MKEGNVLGFSERFFQRFSDKITNEDTWLTLGEAVLKIIIILIISGIVIRFGKSAIRKFFQVRSRSPLRISERREATLSKLLQNVLTYVVFFISLMMILQAMTIDVKALLAGAGIVGLAVGFGAQSLVKDVITGFFIILEDQFSVGDYIRIGQFEGDVMEIGLRTTKIKSFTGELHVIPNGNIMEVTNFSIHNSVAVVDVSIAYDGNIELAESAIRHLLEKLTADYEDLVKPPELLGVQNIGPAEVVMRVVAETKPMRHFFIGRVLRREIKECLDEHGIDIPVPRMVMYNRSESDGKQHKLNQPE
ncbi:mechanosensitive ion channel protein MscS [Bacillus sp. M6-12]|uniref:mechanosensitive ion channel family protein n=1 Tax=Bacillus sp. M6-12 TaxID=2054166 RepID=UPI000C793A3D|nr:mechanosensitive ion channel family protein [Bacillus sp. M6-12]PLS15781.1 mechanosensitive ion channel protein MscS [Bacillus sp. M6-12]